MDELFPLQLSLSFHTKIISSQFITKINHKTFYQCRTNFGIMTLILEEVTKESLNGFNNDIGQPNNSIDGPQSKLIKRKQLLTSYPFCTFIPVIYEQLIIPSHKDRVFCLTLTQPIEILFYKDFHHKVNLELQKFLFLAIENVSKKQQWTFKFLEQNNLKQMTLLRSVIGGQLFVDFTQLQICKKQQEKVSASQIIKTFFNDLHFYQPLIGDQNKIRQIILIKDKLYKISKEKQLTRQYSSWQQVCICLNFLMEQQVLIKIKQTNSKGESIQRTKRTPIKSLCSSSQALTPIQIFDCKDKKPRGHYYFYDGYCTDLLQIVEYQELLKDFFIDNSTYGLKKDTYLWIERVENKQNKSFDAKNANKKSDTILIQQGVQKWECINFFITYCKFIQPTLKRIFYVKEENSLHFQFLGKWKVERELKLVFDPLYVIKDEQLSMIIEKSKIEDLTLQLSGMQITDSFLMFLANSQKMSKIKNLDISYCLKVTENGVNSLLISPFCKSLNVINVSGTPVVQSSIESLLKKGQLKDLIMNNCPVQDVNQANNFVIRNSKLTRLQAMGMNVTGNFGGSLKILKIGTYLPLQFLKELKDMPLKELTIRLVEEKKNIIGGLMGTIGTFYSSKDSNPIKFFAQGTIASKNLKYLDLSHSFSKLKSLRHLFMMSQLQTLKLQNISSTQEVDFSISQKIIDLSFKNTDISVRDLNQLIKPTKILLKLNISNTIIQKSEIVDFLNINKKYVNTLVISQNQYSMNLIDPNGKASQFVETFQIDCKDEFFKLKNEKLLNNMIFKTFRSSKNLKFRTGIEDQAMGYLSKFINWYNIDSAKNIFINDKPYRLVYENMKQKQYRDKKINCGQFLCVHLKNKKPIMIPLKRSLKMSDSNRPQVNNELTNFLYVFRKTILEYPLSTIQISLRGNKVINCTDAVSLIKSYSQYSHIKSIDFRQCTLLEHNILPKILQIPLIESYNHNQYQVFLDNKNFSQLSQKYLKFFMRISSIKKLKLQCKNVNQAELLFSIYFHVFDYHYESIEELDLILQGITMTKQNSTNFWVKLTELKKLKSLKIKINNCSTAFLKKIFQHHLLNQSHHLQTFSIEGIDHTSLNTLQNGFSVRNLAMNFQNSTVTETHLLKLLKPFGPSLLGLQLNLGRCDQITMPNKIFTILGEFKSLESLNISFEQQIFILIKFSCPLKELSTIDFLQNLFSLKKLKQLEINLSFTAITYNSIANVMSLFPTKLPKCYTILYLVGNQSKQIEIDKEALQSQGLQIIL